MKLAETFWGEDSIWRLGVRLQELGFVLAGPRALASGLEAHSLGFSVVSVVFQVGTL